MAAQTKLPQKISKVLRALFGLFGFLLVLFIYTNVYLPVQAALGFTGLLSIVTTVIGLMVVFGGFYILLQMVK